MVKSTIVNNRISRPSSTPGRVPSGAEAVPANVVGPIRRFWDFTKKTTKAFAKNFKDADAKEEEFIKVVRKDSERWS